MDRKQLIESKTCTVLSVTILEYGKSE